VRGKYPYSVGSLRKFNHWTIPVKVTLRLTVSQSVSKSWCRAPFGAHDQILIIIYYRLTVTVLFLWGALSDERSDLSFVYAAGPCQRSLSRVRVPWDSRPYFPVSELRLPRVTVHVFDPASTRGNTNPCQIHYSYLIT
jgi:hypothetical protein